MDFSPHPPVPYTPDDPGANAVVVGSWGLRAPGRGSPIPAGVCRLLQCAGSVSSWGEMAGAPLEGATLPGAGLLAPIFPAGGRLPAPPARQREVRVGGLCRGRAGWGSSNRTREDVHSGCQMGVLGSGRRDTCLMRT